LQVQSESDKLSSTLDFSGKEGFTMTVTLQQCYQEFLQDGSSLYHLKPNTIRAYRYELRAAAEDPRFQGELDKITLTDLESWITRLPAAPSTVARRAATLSRFFDWAIRHKLCGHNPLHAHTPIKAKRRLPRPIQRESDRQAIDTAIASAPLPYRHIFTILRETGMRISEVLDLRIGDVILEVGHETLRVREPKNGIERSVILTPSATPKTLRGLRQHLKGLAYTGEYELLFRSNRGTKLSYDAAHYQWAKLCCSAQLVNQDGHPLYTIHQLRHTRGSELVAQGQRIEIVQRILGHRDFRSTLGYIELNDEQVRAALERPKRR
jgi:integrase/recombinase XerD